METLKLTEKQSKSFINNLTKMINAVNKYNIEPIILVQLYVTAYTIEPIIVSKPFDNIDIFDYMKRIYQKDEAYYRNLKYMDMSKIKKKVDHEFYSPMIFASFSAIPFMRISPEDMNKTELLLPSKIQNSGYYTNSFFLVTDLFKDFVKNNTITAVDSSFRLYDECDAVYDTSAFLYPNNSTDNFKNVEFIKKISPKKLLPISLHEELDDNSFLNEHFRELLVNLNSTMINLELHDYLSFRENIGIINEEENKFKELIENINSEADFYISNESSTFVMKTYAEFFKNQKFKNVVFTKKNSVEKYGVDNKIPIQYCGLGLQYHNFIIYIFYKMFLSEDDE